MLQRTRRNRAYGSGVRAIASGSYIAQTPARGAAGDLRMDGEKIDRFTRRLTAGTSRRGAVGSVLAGVTALLLGADSLNAEPGGNGKSNGNGQENRGDKKPEKTPGNVNAKNTTKAKGKVWLCHKPTSAINPTTGLLDASRRQGV